jgi:hypothetical protein
MPKYQNKRNIKSLQSFAVDKSNKTYKQQEKLTARPTAPNPKTATDWPFLGFATFKVAPRPFKHKTKYINGN